MGAAWAIAREHGLAGLSMRDLGDRVGMRAQSVYSYFSSKHDIYDAMFLEGYQAFIDRLDEVLDDADVAGDPTGAVVSGAHAFVEFCTDDPARFQLLFLRTIPGFTPSPASYTVALQAYERMADQLAIVGAHDQPTLDLWSATLTGLASQQIANDPGGDRWKQLTDRAVRLLLNDPDLTTESEQT